MHKILLNDNAKTSIEHQRRLNPMMKEVVRKEVLKWLNAGFIYAISYSMGPRGRFHSYKCYIGLFGTSLYMGRAPRTKETLLDFRERGRVTRHSRVFPRVDG